MFFSPKPKPKRKKAQEMLVECSEVLDSAQCQIKQMIRSHLELVDKEVDNVE